ncbi:metaphase-anaphase transition protein-like protein mlo2 [Coleophoma cylindrospora]|uniref:Metaphase-anaphase transition protein-like protein mlo2 n=1 Tax=Coleophoma cylindrospora TaxID=1849047 RepID=A0A3D8RC39_9HELO|nr:metaphase-anaphase transition protein-like protein mlo2 [Coleophoma cylindrospora]
MDPPPVPDTGSKDAPGSQASALGRSESFSQQSDDSRTAAEQVTNGNLLLLCRFIDEQLQLEADAREALPYSIDTCTKPLGALRQILFACLTCNPEPANPSDPYTPAGVCYSCSVQCHGDHELVELFSKRNFTCDCGTTRLPSTSPCTLRLNPKTNTEGGVHSETPAPGNKYNQNFRNRFCGCENLYDPFMQKGTMFQCLGLGTAEDGGCGEDWWHPSCIVGLAFDGFSMSAVDKLRRDAFTASVAEVAAAAVSDSNGDAQLLSEALESTARKAEQQDDDDDPPLPPGFPHEDDFEGFICYKCVDSNPWIKVYASAPGFLAPVFYRSAAPSPETGLGQDIGSAEESTNPRKRKAEDDGLESIKKPKADEAETELNLNDKAISTGTTGTMDKNAGSVSCKAKALSTPPSGQFSLFFKPDFREHLCRCSDCFSNLAKHPQLLEEEETYEPPLSEDGGEGGSTVGSGSIYERGESALKNVDRVKAIEGVMAYNHLKDKLKPFFQQFAESGQAISADDIKAHFAKMRGDEQAIKDAGQAAKENKDSDSR